MAHRLRLLSYNVHGLRDDVGALASVVRGANPDIVVVQEGPRRIRWRTRSAALASRLGMFVAGGGEPALGNLVLVGMRVRVHGDRCVQFPLTPGRHMRGVVFGRCEVAGVRFTIAGSHLSTDPFERPRQAELLKKQLSEVDGPLIFAGDLNDDVGDTAWRTVAEGLTDAATAGAADDVPTFSCGNPSRRIDAIFVDPRCRVLTYRVLDSPEVRRASDHFPLLAEIALPE
jgi:endonuclease/exonuclease/phosphatase family metal-dependent hydrolase